MKKYEILTDKGLKEKHHDKISGVEKCFVVLSEKNSGIVLQFNSKTGFTDVSQKEAKGFP